LRRRNENSLVGSWLLSAEDLIECGLSKAKTRAIIEFGGYYSSRPTEIEAWSGLPVEDLRREVTSFWGLSDWSADILAISHFGHPDVFPKNDTTLQRAIRMAIDAYGLKPSDWKIEEVRPFRTYLALYLWRSVDMKFWNRFQVEQVLTKHSRPL
jgi:DNA-3-methyladenine glycosylase II